MNLPRSYADVLVRAALAGDRAAFDRLFDAGFSVVWRDASRHAPALADETTATCMRQAVIECLEKALEQRGQPDAAALAAREAKGWQATAGREGVR
ncbi:MAG TPA: hypothetical protein VHQ66_07700 [Myxococcota bacterium]|jgi:hypothetical protein|nr:hypothetical protein [Myxococcota bacterium]